MAKKILLISGHGAGDSGAVATHSGVKYQEAVETVALVRKIAADLDGYDVATAVYPCERDAYQDYKNGTYEKAVAVANSRPTENIFRIQQATGDRDYASRVPIPANAMFIVSAGTATNVTFFVSNEAGFTRVGTADVKTTNIGFKLANDVEVTKQVNLEDKSFDYNGHFITGGGSVVTTGAIYTNGGGNLSAIIADFEARIRALEGSAEK